MIKSKASSLSFQRITWSDGVFYGQTKLSYIAGRNMEWKSAHGGSKTNSARKKFTDGLGNSKIPFWGLRGNRKDHFPIDFVCHCKIREPAALPPEIWDQWTKRTNRSLYGGMLRIFDKPKMYRKRSGRTAGRYPCKDQAAGMGIPRAGHLRVRPPAWTDHGFWRQPLSRAVAAVAHQVCGCPIYECLWPQRRIFRRGSNRLLQYLLCWWLQLRKIRTGKQELAHEHWPHFFGTQGNRGRCQSPSQRPLFPPAYSVFRERYAHCPKKNYGTYKKTQYFPE